MTNLTFYYNLIIIKSDHNIMIEVFLSVFDVFEPSSKPLTMLCSILQIRKLKHKAVMKTLQGHPPRSRSWDLGRLASPPACQPLEPGY